MRFRKTALLFLFVYPIVTFGEPARTANIDQLQWMSGCWASDGAEAGSGEQWMQPAGGEMLGLSRYIRDNKTVAFEFLRIFENDAGSLSLFAAPSGQASHTFELISLSDNEAVFADPDHDFPQRILYRLLEPNRMLGRIEGIANGKQRAIDFPLTRQSCEV